MNTVTAELIEAPFRKIGYALVQNSLANTLVEISRTQLADYGLVPNQLFQCTLSESQEERASDRIPTHLSSVTSLYTTTHITHVFNVLPKTFVCGVLVIDSKVTFGVNSKGMRKYKFVPQDMSYPQYIVASKVKQSASSLYARVEITTWSPPHRATANLVETLGNVSDRSIIEHVLQHAYNLAIKPMRIPTSESDILSSRIQNRIEHMKAKHMRPREVIAVDPDGCVDADDAMSLDSNRVGVHITDLVSHYSGLSKVDDILDHARRRVATVYGTQKTTHLLPESIGCDSASLLPNKDRLSLSVYFSKDGTTEIVRDIVHVKCAVSYENAESHKLVDQICAFCTAHLGFEHDSTHTMRSKQLVEFLMISANSVIADHLVKYQRSTRVPLRITPPHGNGGAIYVTRERAAQLQWSTHHDGLGKSAYTHFTSPIRRVADQLVHASVCEICDVFDKEEDKLVVSKMLDAIEKDLFWCNVVTKRIRQYESLCVWFQDEVWMHTQSDDARTLCISASGTVLEVYGPYARVNIASPNVLRNRIARVEWIPPKVWYALFDDTQTSVIETYTTPELYASITFDVHWNPLHGIKGLVFVVKN